MALLFIFIGLADALRLPVIAGGFLAGMALSAFPVSGMVRGHLRSISDFFMAVFFTALGAFIAFPTPDELLKALILAAHVVAITGSTGKTSTKDILAAYEALLPGEGRAR